MAASTPPARTVPARTTPGAAVIACLLAAWLLVLLAGCGKAPPGAAASAPKPAEVTAQATGHYCGMQLAEHEGPKGQIFLASWGDPVWFSSVRDTIAYLRLPEEPRDVAAVYVNDMGRAKNWAQPEPGTWTDARTAWYVIDSAQRGGMGAPEAVPFSDRAAAQAFRDRHGGRVVRLDDIPDAYVLGPVDLSDPARTGAVQAAPAAPAKPAPAQAAPAHASGASSH